MYTTRGFQASSEPFIHFGFGSTKQIDSLKIIWPDRTFQVVRNVQLNQTLEISPENVHPYHYNTGNNIALNLFKKVDDNLGIDFRHIEDSYIDFNLEVRPDIKVYRSLQSVKN